jgi:hypothetical protein
VRWAAGGASRRVIHAPTPSDEPLDLPAILIASFPMTPDRRHVAPGPLTDFLIERAAAAYAELLRTAPPTPALLDLVPGPMGQGEVDANLRGAVRRLLPDVPMLPVSTGTPGETFPDGAGETFPDGAGEPGPAEEIRVAGRDAVVVDGPAAPFADVLAGLLPVGWPARHPALSVLGVRRLGLADAVDLLAGLQRPPGWWRNRYEGLGGADLETLRALPVPLADGRTVRGPRGLLIAAGGVDPNGLTALGLRFVHPDAVHPLLLRLGAVEAGPRAVLTADGTRAAVAASFDEEDPGPIAAAVLDLVAAVGGTGRADDPGATEPWLADLALNGDDGEIYPAGELLLPDSPLRSIMAEDAPFAVVEEALVERYGAGTLRAAGVLDGFAVLRVEDVVLDPDGLAELQLDDVEEWAERVGGGEVPEFVAVRDLEFVASWEGALDLLAAPPLRNLVALPVHVRAPGGGRRAVPSYTAWWLREHATLGGHRPGDLCVPGDPRLADLFAAAPEDLDAEFLRALGVASSVEDLLAEPGGAERLLARMTDRVPARLRELWRALALADLSGVAVPERLPAWVDGSPEQAPTKDVIVADRPDAVPVLAGQPLLLLPADRAEEVADALGLSLASEEVSGEVQSAGVARPVPEIAADLLPEAPGSYLHHDNLIVDGTEVSWWCADDGTVHAADPAGLARGLAWQAGRWPERLLVAALLTSPESAAVLLAESDLE